MSLARDAQSSGDPVLAENYLQHAEHYNRIIMAYREQMHQPGDPANGNGQRMRLPGEGEGVDEFGEDEGEDMLEGGFMQPPMQQPQPQPPRQHGGFEGGGGRHDRPFRRDRDHRFRDRDRMGDRPDRQQQGGGDGRPAMAQERQDAAGGGEPGNEPRRRDRFQQPHEQPDFLRRPVRRTRSEGDDPANKDEPSRD